MGSPAFCPKIENENELIIIQGSSVMATISPVTLKFAVLGSFVDKDDIMLVQDIIECESNGIHYNSNGTVKRGKAGEYGIAQFMPATWNLFNKIRGTNLDITNEQDQLDMLFWALETNRGFNWTCWRKLQ